MGRVRMGIKKSTRITNSDRVATQIEPKEIWIGLVEVRPLEGCDMLEEAKGAYVNVVMWVANADAFKHRAESISSELRLFVVDVKGPEPVAERRRREGDFEEEIEDMILRAQEHPTDVVFGTFHLWEKDDA
jgi:hypothetical protein